MDFSGSWTTWSFATTYLSSTKEKHLFTFRKVGLLCQRMLKERGS
jgi:hypothetical protein